MAYLNEIKDFAQAFKDEDHSCLEIYGEFCRTVDLYPLGQSGIVATICGLNEESGEVAGVLKRVFRKDPGYAFMHTQRDRMRDELGDVLWYIQAIARRYELTLEDIFCRNIEKLSDRKARNVLHGEGDGR